MRSRTLWTAKYLVMNALSRVPFHEKLHFAGQRLLGRHRLDAEEMFRRALELFLLLRRAGGDVRGKAVFEIGTGWFPFAAALAHLYGAREVVTVDIHPWLTLKNAVRTFESARRLGEGAARRVGADPNVFAARAERLASKCSSARSLGDLLAAANIRYLYKTDLLEADLPEESFEVFLSSNVLEHIDPGTLAKIHEKTANLARQGAFAVHRFNPGDHCRKLSGSSVSFLEHDEARWRRLGGYGLSFHNRMRTCEHAEAVKRSPWSLALWAEAMDRDAVGDIREGRVSPAGRFAGMSPESLSAWYAWFVMRKNCGLAVAQPTRVKWIGDLLCPTETGV